MIPVYRVADYNAWIFLFFPVSFYLEYCQDYHISILFNLLCIIVRSIIQFDFETYVINISENIAIDIPV